MNKRVRGSGFVAVLATFLLLGCRPSSDLDGLRPGSGSPGTVIAQKSMARPPSTGTVVNAIEPQSSHVELSAALAEGTATPLSVQLGGTIALKEAQAARGTARTVKFDVRDSDGSKTSLVDQPLEPNQRVTYRARRPGYASVHRCTRPAELDDLPDAWQIASLCEITHMRVGAPGEGDWQSDAHLTTKIGLPVELRPYRSTAQLEIGDVLPVRLYHKGMPMSGLEVIARSPKGKMSSQTTNERGVAHFEISSAGRWVIEGVVNEPALLGGEAKVRLYFDVKGSAPAKEAQ